MTSFSFINCGKCLVNKMNYAFKPMTIRYLEEISTWRYDGFVKELYTRPYFDNHKKKKTILKGPDNCDGYVVVKDKALIGLYEYYIRDGYIEIGLALNPKYVGKDYSKDFIKAGIQFCINHYDYTNKYILLNVKAENMRAYKAYLKAGFIETKKQNNDIEMRYYL